MGLQVELLACNERYVDPEHPFLSCEIDFELRLTGSWRSAPRAPARRRARQRRRQERDRLRAQEVGRGRHRGRAHRVRRAVHARPDGHRPPDVPGRRAAQLRRRRHLLDAARRRDDRRDAAEAGRLLGRPRARRRAARPAQVRRHQGAVPARQRPGRRGDAGHRRQGRAAARGEGAHQGVRGGREALTFEIAEHISPHTRLLRRPGHR
jgi:hypothetical protein